MRWVTIWSADWFRSDLGGAPTLDNIPPYRVCTVMNE